MNVLRKGSRMFQGIVIFQLTVIILLLYKKDIKDVIQEIKDHETFQNLAFSWSGCEKFQNSQAIQSPGNTVPRVTCMIFVTVKKWSTRGEAARRTWSRHCYRRRFFYSKTDAELPSSMKNISDELVALDVKDGRKNLTAKTMAAFDYSFRNFQNDTDWFMKADDDIYIVYDHLIQYLSNFDPSKPFYLGSNIKNTQKHVPNGFNSGGAGYLLSHRAAVTLVHQARCLYPSKCSGTATGGAEDVDMADCLQKFKIFSHNTLDGQGRNRFESQNPLRLMKGVLQENIDDTLEVHRSAEYLGKIFSQYSLDPEHQKMMSNESISFHYVSPAEMYMYDFLIGLLNSPQTEKRT